MKNILFFKNKNAGGADLPVGGSVQSRIRPRIQDVGEVRGCTDAGSKATSKTRLGGARRVGRARSRRAESVHRDRGTVLRRVCMCLEFLEPWWSLAEPRLTYGPSRSFRAPNRADQVLESQILTTTYWPSPPQVTPMGTALDFGQIRESAWKIK